MYKFKRWAVQKLLDYLLPSTTIDLTESDELALIRLVEDAPQWNAFKRLNIRRRQEIQASTMQVTDLLALYFNKGRYFENINAEKQLHRYFLDHQKKQARKKKT